MQFPWEMSELPFFETWCLKILTVNLRNAQRAKSFQTPTSSRQHININLFPHTTTTTARPPTAAVERPGQCPYVGQPRAGLSTSTIPCTTPPPPLCSNTHVACPRNHIEDNDNELEGLKECEESGYKGKRRLGGSLITAMLMYHFHQLIEMGH